MIKKIFTGTVFLSILFTLLISRVGEFIPRYLEMVFYFATFFLLGRYFASKSEGFGNLLKLLIFPLLFSVFIFIFTPLPKGYFQLASLAFIFIGAFCGHVFVRKESFKWIGSSLGLVALIIACFYTIDEDTVVSNWAYKDIPASVEGFVFTTEDGSKLTSNDLKNDVVILDFWFWGCKPCHQKMPDLQKYYESHPEQKVYSVFDPMGNTKSYAEAVKELRERGYTFPILLSDSETNRSLFLVEGFPTIMKVEQGKNVTFKGGKFSGL